MKKKRKEKKDWLRELIRVMARLRSQNGCPWDREQDHSTLKKYLIEESYELIDAIDDRDDEGMCEELGDVLLQILFHSQIAEEEKRFDIQKVAQTCCEKLIRRHPHVFKGTHIEDAEGVKKQWEEIKRREKSGLVKSALDGVPRHLPALSQAEKIQKKAAQLGFDWKEVDGVVAKIDEELSEVKEELKSGDRKRIREELGDLLFAVVNLSRFQKESPEELLRDTVKKFNKTFQFNEKFVDQSGRKWEDFTLDELEAFWRKSKKQ